MRIIKPYTEIIDTQVGTDVLRKIEFVGRTCYKSTDKITDESAPKFVANLVKRSHEAMLEHASFCFEINYGLWKYMVDVIGTIEECFGFQSFLRFTVDGRILVSGNVRAWRDFFKCMNEKLSLPKCFEGFIKMNPVLFPEFQEAEFREQLLGAMLPIHAEDLHQGLEQLIHNDVTVKFVVDRGISHELVRHRPASFAQESTRYCNYSKYNFDGEITFIEPFAFKQGTTARNLWIEQIAKAEAVYLDMTRDIGVTPEWARTVLPNSLKTEVVMTANLKEWRHFFALRACNLTGKAHPQMLEVAQPLLDKFKGLFDGVFDDLIYE